MGRLITDSTPENRELIRKIRELLEKHGNDNFERAYAEASEKFYLEALTQNSILKKVKIGRLKKFIRKENDKKEFELENALDGVRQHQSMFTKDKKPFLLVFQPYQLDSKATANLVKFCSDYDLEFEITTHSYYFFGKTLLVEIWNKDDKRYG